MLPFCGSVYQFIHEILESRREDAPPPTTPTSQGEEPLIDVVEEGITHFVLLIKDFKNDENIFLTKQPCTCTFYVFY